jgi:PAS domain S-box-containing protein
VVRKPTYEELEQRIEELESEAALRKRAEEALRETGERFSAFMENYPAHIYIKDEAGRHIYGNRAALDITRTRWEEFIGATSHDFFPADIARKIEETDRFVQTEKVARELEYAVRMPDGKVHWIRDVKFPIHLPHHRTLLGGIALDITDRKEKEEKLQMMQFSIDHALDRIAWIAPDGRFLYANEAACKEMGYTLEEVLSMSVSDINPNFPVERWAEHYQEVKKRVSMGLETQQIAGDGQTHDIEVSANYVKFGDREFMCSFGRDITERKRAEEALRQNEKQLRLMADSLPVFISYVDAEQRYRFNNIAYEKLFGISRDDIVGHHIREILGNQVYESIREYVEMALAGEEVRYETDLSIADGTIRCMVVTYVPHFSDEGKPLGFYSLAEDVTDRKQAEDEARRHREALFHVDRVATMGELSASLAHELNQPLSAIVSNAQAAQRFLAADPPDLDEVKDILSDIVNDGTRASEVIGRLRTFLKKAAPDYHPLDINEAIRDVIILVGRDAMIRNVSIVTELGAALPPVLGDRIQLQQVILNLISNGTDAMMNVDANDRRLIIRTEKPDQESVKVAVRDFGIGLDEEDINRIFEPFTTIKSDGMGMGLSISRTIIETHGGRLWATNNPDRGATFYFTVPACKNKK